MQILIIGHLGYIGPVVIQQLSKNKKNKLNGIDAGYFYKRKFFKNLQNKIITKFKDVRRLNSNDIKGYDKIVYLAAISNDPMGNVFEKVTNEINYKSAIKIAKIAKKYGTKKFVYASSCSMYGFTENLIKNENSKLNPLTAYAKSKVKAEKNLKKLSSKNFKVISLRFATACGYSENLRLDLVLNDFVASAIANKEIKVLSDGSPWRPLIHVKDMAKAINWALDEIRFNRFLALNIGMNKMNFQVKTIARKVGRIIKNTKVKINHKAMPDKRSYKVDFSKFQKMNTKYKLNYDLEKSIIDLKKNLKKIDFKTKKFRESNFIRLKILKNLLEKKKVDKKLYFKK